MICFIPFPASSLKMARIFLSDERTINELKKISKKFKLNNMTCEIIVY